MFKSKLERVIFVIVLILSFCGVWHLQHRTGRDAMSRSPKILSMADYKPGRVATGYTVFHGTDISPFSVLLGDVMTYGNSRYILARIWDGPAGIDLKRTGAIGGMSGSPIYWDGKLVGALSIRPGDLFIDGMNAGVTPAEDMLAMADTGTTKETRVATLPTGWQFIPPLPGASQHLGAADLLSHRPVSPAAGAAEISLASSTDAYGSCTADNTPSVPLRPGSAITVYLITGDMKYAVTGTVTWVDQDRIYAFGHPFLKTGDVRYPFKQTTILGVIQSGLGSFKIAGCSFGQIGTITHDEAAAISGTTRQMAIPEIPVSVSFRSGPSTITKAARMVEVPGFTRNFLSIVPYLMISDDVPKESLWIERTTRLCVKNEPELFAKTVTHAEPAIPGAPAEVTGVKNIGRLIDELNKSEFPHALASLQVDVTVLPAFTRWRREDIFLSAKKAVPGETVMLTVAVRKHPDGATAQFLHVPVFIPKDILTPLLKDKGSCSENDAIAPTSAVVQVLVQSVDEFTDLRDAHALPRSLAAYIADLNKKAVAHNKIIVQIQYPPRPASANSGCTGKSMHAERSYALAWQTAGETPHNPEPKTDVRTIELPALEGLTEDINETLTIVVSKPSEVTKVQPVKRPHTTRPAPIHDEPLF